ncbi:MAG: dihydrodipicolinate synthase family protein, partial [Micromonosporaceae bacterium]
PGLDIICGSDDVVLELAIAGAPGWIAGIPNALPAQCAALWQAARAGDLAAAVPAYRRLHPLLRWDARTEFVQAIKLAMDLSGRYGGACRPPRGPLSDEQAAVVRAATELALGA